MSADKKKASGQEESPHGDIKKRETWTNKFDFLLACIGFSVGLGNVWRFPYLCYKNGGGAFLIPYVICVVVGGIPLFYLEVAVGQFMGIAGINTWKIVPIFKGIALSSVTVVFLLNCYYNVILAWAWRYFFASFTSKLPWAECDYDDWATPQCDAFDPNNPIDNRCIYIENDKNVSGVFINGVCQSVEFATNNSVTRFNTSGTDVLLKTVDPVVEYWERKVLGLSDSIEDMGVPKWDLALCLLFAWIVVYLCICKGIKSSGKVMYVTATSPYIFMLVLLIRNCLLEGAGTGVIYYLKPDFSKMNNIDVWVDAGTQIFFSYSIAIGTLTVLGSYNKFNHNSYRDCIVFAVTNSGTSIFSGFLIFSILGHMAHVQGKPIGEVAEKGPGLAFVAYPKALALMPVAPLWSCLFFLMIILLGLDSQFVGVEGVVTVVVDQYPQYLRKGYRREIFIAIVCIAMFLVGLVMVCPGGMYVFQLFDHYSGSKIILFIAFFECIAIAWIYGINRFYDNLQMMYGFRINPYMKIMWVVFSPLFCMVVFVLSTISYSELSYDRPSKETYHYPAWAVGIGWSLAGIAAIWIPIAWVYHVVKYGGDMERFRQVFRPMGFQAHQMRPQDYGQIGLDGPQPSVAKDEFGMDIVTTATQSPKKADIIRSPYPPSYDNINEDNNGELNEGFEDGPVWKDGFTTRL